jgi:hypothetical protein
MMVEPVGRLSRPTAQSGSASYSGVSCFNAANAASSRLAARNFLLNNLFMWKIFWIKV